MPERYGYGGLQESETQASTSSLDLFAPEPVESRIYTRKPCLAKPTSGIQGGPFDVVLPSEKRSFIDPASIRVNAAIRIKRVTDGVVSDLPTLTSLDETDVIPVNLMTKSLFKDIEVELENNKISLNASNTYGIKAYVTTMLSYGADAKAGHLKCSLYEDDVGDFDVVSTNTGGHKRFKYIQNSGVLKFSDNLHTELTTCHKYITPGVSVKLKFILEDPSFFLLTKTSGLEHIVEYQDFYITYDRILVKESEHESIERQLLTTPAIYPITRTEILRKGYATGLTSLDWDNCYHGYLPEQVLICMNTQEAADGKTNKNPFNFKKFGMKNISLIVNSHRNPSIPVEFIIPGEGYDLRNYRHFCDSTGIDLSNASSLIGCDEYQEDGYIIVPFDLTTDRCALVHAHQKIEGNISLDIKLRAGTTEAINVYLICIYRDYFYIQGAPDSRKISLQYPTKK